MYDPRSTNRNPLRRDTGRVQTCGAECAAVNWATVEEKMSDETIERRLQELRDIAQRFAKAYALKEHIDEFKKSKLAILMKQAERDGQKTSAGQEREARAHREYLELLDGLKDATEQAEALRWQLKLAEIGVEIWRTQQSTKRAEMMGYGNRT